MIATPAANNAGGRKSVMNRGGAAAGGISRVERGSGRGGFPIHGFWRSENARVTGTGV